MYAGEHGFPWPITTNLDLTGATAIRVRIKPPDPHLVIEHDLDASVITNPANGTITYLVAAGDLPVAGGYQVQVSDISPGREVDSEVLPFVVNEPL